MSKKTPKRKKAAPKKHGKRGTALSSAAAVSLNQKLPVYGAKGEVAVIQPKGAVEFEPELSAEQLFAQLTPQQQIFAMEYLRNGFNATRAYKLAHPDVSLEVSQVEGHRDLRKPKIAAWLKTKLEAAWRPLQMGGEEALARVANIITFDVRMLFDAKDKLLPVSKWPDEAGVLIESLDLEKGKMKLPSRLAALRLVLEQSGKLKSLAGGLDELAEAIRADKREHGEAQL